MRHTREAVVERATREFERLDALVAGLSEHDWHLRLAWSETKDPWTIKDAVAHITHWKADTARKVRGRPPPPEERGLSETAGNRLVYERWRDRDPRDVLDWHRQVQDDLMVALREAPDAWFSKRERSERWPYDIDGHSEDHRVKDIEQALLTSTRR
ncbi:MAG: maleylpyruvate isomerase N-terminal domain-containing protein [Candidatus Limnocylindrales bacterium]